MSRSGAAALLSKLPPPTGRLVTSLRAAVRRAIPWAAESVLWGALSYHRPRVGGRVKGSVCMIRFKGDEVLLEFIHGVRLADPAGLLQGQLLSKRFIPIRTVADAKRPEVAALIDEAAGLVWPDAKRRRR